MPDFVPLMRLAVEVGEIASIGDTPTGERRFVPITGGTFDSEDGWHGQVRPGGADWQLLRRDGVLEVDARYVLQDERGQRVQVASQGLRHGPPEVIAALARGEAVDASLYYFRTAMRFETAAAGLMHLNHVIAFGIGAREARLVYLNVFALA
jgi:Protein of unknown function (DUF3237)